MSTRRVLRNYPQDVGNEHALGRFGYGVLAACFAGMGLVPLSEVGAGLLAEALGANALFLIGGSISPVALALGAPRLLRR